ncbi:O-methyltransferase [Texcoconibacillus texcoconensis]|uniref:tRNA 5-hydroxyuridine methyltransferase n=1 Tax=Texcoconibacillus texcoconensis TaxID=1095777 RepID=A0A840QP58_9BACI|nr:O-methyltransferase [Texcoconibacillus texcoconensis]MBB5173172.1 putative O-methyltransferase YrrM [Texcoconibacillus texcoconensis]
MWNANETGSYITSLLPPSTALFKEMEQYANINEVPIIEKDGLCAIIQLLNLHKTTQILEVGAAIGYSALQFVANVDGAHVTTIEKDDQRAKEARSFIDRSSFANKITLFEGDAFDHVASVKKNAPYDVLFIDAAKGKYDAFFDTFEPLVKIGGLIISDNVLFKGYVTGEVEAETRGLRQMIKKIDRFNKRIMSDERFHSMIYPIGDGLLVSQKKY